MPDHVVQVNGHTHYFAPHTDLMAVVAKILGDGFLGPKCVDAWNQIYAAAVAKDAQANWEFPSFGSMEQLAT